MVGAGKIDGDEARRDRARADEHTIEGEHRGDGPVGRKGRDDAGAEMLCGIGELRRSRTRRSGQQITEPAVIVGRIEICTDDQR